MGKKCNSRCRCTEGAETHRALHRARQRMQRFSAMYTLSEGRQGRGENTLKWENGKNCFACIITTSPQIMRPKCALPMHTNIITQPLHTVHTGYISATFSVSMYCARRADATI